MTLGRTSVLNHSSLAPTLEHSQSQTIQALSRGVAKSVGTVGFLIPSLSGSWERCASKELLSLWHTGHASCYQVPRLILSASVSTYEMGLTCILGALLIPLGVQNKAEQPGYPVCSHLTNPGQVGPHREVTTGRRLHKRQILMGEHGQHFSGALVPYHGPVAMAQL